MSIVKNGVKINILLKKTNTFITLVDINNLKVLKTFSCGSCGLKGTKKRTSIANTIIVLKTIDFLTKLNYTHVSVIFSGIGLFKQIILKTFIMEYILKFNLVILEIKDITSYPYNGCRAKNLKS